jgi:hypothetical protein
MTESDIRACKVGSITICPANTAIMDAQITCESELFFQRATKERTCQRKLMVHYDTHLGPVREQMGLPFPDTQPADVQMPARQHVEHRDTDPGKRWTSQERH